ncbi:MAG: TGS domain-containing protein [Bacteroidales bacterium]|nr:TGS domain-containing protein [Bacteroidales bacterium]
MIAEKLETYIKSLNFDDAQYFKNNLINIENNGAVESEEAEELTNIVANEISADSTTVSCAIAFAYIPNDKINTIIESNVLGEEINSILKGILKIPPFNLEKLKLQTENHIKLLVTLSGDVRAIIIMLALHLLKIRKLKSLSEEEAFKTATEVQLLYSPIAHRIGLYKVKTEMEEICLKYFDYETYRSIADKLQIKKAERDKYIHEFIEPLKKKFADNGLKVNIKGRPKSIASIRTKMKKQGIDVDGIYDLFAIRVIIDSKPENEKSDCWKVYSIVTEEYKPNPYRLRDWISVPKPSGYESLHTTVIGPGGRWVEVQIRTERMDEIAEKGLAAHWKYKNGTDGQQGGNIFSRIREAIETPDRDKKISSEKKALYSNEIYIFTPNGDLIKMHQGETVLDFAFSIHSEIGSKCIGAHVNNKFVSIKQVLQNGDTVKILTANNQKPSPEWIKIAQNQRVKNRIKHIVTGMQNRLAEIGKDTVKQKLQQINVEFNDLTVNKLVKYFNIESTIQFYQNIGEGKIDPIKIKQAFNEKIEQKPIEEEHKFTDHLSDKSSDCLIIDNLNTVDFQFAKCCQPLPGDKIFAFVTVNKGTKIHSVNCPNAANIIKRYPYRIINAVWKKDAEQSSFSINIKLEGIYSHETNGKINEVITNDFHIHVRSYSFSEQNEGKFVAHLTVTLGSKAQQDFIIEKLKRIKNVEKVVIENN